MAYTNDPIKCRDRLRSAGILQLAEQMASGDLNDSRVIHVGSSTEVDRIKHLLYSFFKHEGITGAYRIKWHGPMSILIEPTIQRVNIFREKRRESGTDEDA